MMNNLVHLSSVCLCVIFILFTGFPLQGQVYSDEQLLETGISAYEHDDFTRAAMYLFAYTQRDPVLIRTDQRHANQVHGALKYAQQNAAAAAGTKGDYPGKETSGSKPDLNRPPKSSTSSKATNLTGRWRCNDGGVYFLHQVHNELWWYGQSQNSGRYWTNVFHGKISGNQVVGNWADIPHGQARNYGKMTLTIVNNGKLKAIHKTGGFGGSVWTR